ncbi:hypothetical protein TU58_30020 [Bacillus cereus]|nr:hypothetical protein TU58_30020 [Bacillus cereus]
MILNAKGKTRSGQSKSNLGAILGGKTISEDIQKVFDMHSYVDNSYGSSMVSPKQRRGVSNSKNPSHQTVQRKSLVINFLR